MLSVVLSVDVLVVTWVSLMVVTWVSCAGGHMGFIDGGHMGFMCWWSHGFHVMQVLPQVITRGVRLAAVNNTDTHADWRSTVACAHVVSCAQVMRLAMTRRSMPGCRTTASSPLRLVMSAAMRQARHLETQCCRCVGCVESCVPICRVT
jgi:hypothetical protein